MSEIISNALYMSLIGILVVFTTLAVLVLGVFLFKKIDEKFSKKRSYNIKNDNNIDEKKLVIISAAVCGYFKNMKNVRIKSVTVLPFEASKNNVWLSIGKQLLQGSHNPKK